MYLGGRHFEIPGAELVEDHHYMSRVIDNGKLARDLIATGQAEFSGPLKNFRDAPRDRITIIEALNYRGEGLYTIMIPKGFVKEAETANTA